MVTDQQVLLLRRKLMEGKTQQASAASAGTGVRSARRWQRGPLPSEKREERSWRTHPDAFAGVWDEEIVPLLRVVRGVSCRRQRYWSGWASVIPDVSAHHTCGPCRGG